MSTRFKGFALLAILLCAIGVMPVFASPYALQNTADTVNSTNANVTSGNTNPSPSMYNPSSSGAITVTTDKPSYNDGDKITISGSTQEYISGTPVTVKIISPIGNIVKIDQVDLGSDRTFSTTITAAGTLWNELGPYQVIVQFGSKDRSAETTFQFTPGPGVSPKMHVEGTDFDVDRKSVV